MRLFVAAKPRSISVGPGAFETQSPFVRTAFGFASGLFVLGAIVSLVGVGNSLRQIACLQSRCRPNDDERLDRTVERARRRLGMAQKVGVWIGPGDGFPTPATWGLLRPTLYIPPTFPAWLDEAMESIVLHELAHVKRRDWPVATFARFVAALYWFVPVNRGLLRDLTVSVELECDRAVVESGVSPAVYAQTLIAARRSADAPAAAMSTLVPEATLEQRIRHILAPSRPRSRSMLVPVAALSLGLVVMSRFLVGSVQAAIDASSPASLTRAQLQAELAKRHPGVRVVVWAPRR